MGGIRVIESNVCAAVGGRDDSVGGGEVGVDNTSTEKMQALSNNVSNTKLVSSDNGL